MSSLGDRPEIISQVVLIFRKSEVSKSIATSAKIEGDYTASRGAQERSGRLELCTIEKGCDIGYALAVNSCEEAASVDACTVTALDAITAFAVPNPNCSSQSQSVFSGLVARPVTLSSRSPSLLRIGNVLFSPTLSAVDGCQVK